MQRFFRRSRLQTRQFSAFRSHTCGDLRHDHNVGEQVVLSGWVDAIRPFGPMSFVSLRDRYGITQLVLEKAALSHAGKG